MGENKIDFMKTLMLITDIDNRVTDAEYNIISNALHDIVERALQTEDKIILQACDRLGLLENGQWQNLKS